MPKGYPVFFFVKIFFKMKEMLLSLKKNVYL